MGTREYFDVGGERALIVSLRSGNAGVFVSCGTYTEHHQWTGRSYTGNVPKEELVRWAIREGYLKEEIRV